MGVKLRRFTSSLLKCASAIFATAGGVVCKYCGEVKWKNGGVLDPVSANLGV
jgi:hypothetical protein